MVKSVEDSTCLIVWFNLPINFPGKQVGYSLNQRGHSANWIFSVYPCKCGPQPALYDSIFLSFPHRPSISKLQRFATFYFLLSLTLWLTIMASSTSRLWTYLQNHGETTSETWLPCTRRVRSQSKTGTTKRKYLVVRGCNWESEARNGGYRGCKISKQNEEYVTWVRGAHPYLHAHRGSTFVVVISGEVIQSPGFHSILKVSFSPTVWTVKLTNLWW